MHSSSAVARLQPTGCAAIDRYLVLAGPTTAAAVCGNRMGQTDGQTQDSFTDPDPHYYASSANNNWLTSRHCTEYTQMLTGNRLCAIQRSGHGYGGCVGH